MKSIAWLGTGILLCSIALDQQEPAETTKTVPATVDKDTGPSDRIEHMFARSAFIWGDQGAPAIRAGQDATFPSRAMQARGDLRAPCLQRRMMAARSDEQEAARRHQRRRQPRHLAIGAQSCLRVLARAGERRRVADDDVEALAGKRGHRVERVAAQQPDTVADAVRLRCLPGLRHDVPDMLAALDLFVLSSRMHAA